MLKLLIPLLSPKPSRLALLLMYSHLLNCPYFCLAFVTLQKRIAKEVKDQERLKKLIDKVRAHGRLFAPVCAHTFTAGFLGHR